MSYEANDGLNVGDRVEVCHEGEKFFGTIFYIKSFDTNEEFYVVKKEGAWDTDSYKRNAIRKVR